MPHIAYFSAEIGFTPDVPSYSGGLGVLAGDHLKAAADAGLSVVGITLLYRHGYFRQHLAADGWQLESYPTFSPEPLLERLPHSVEVRLRDRRVHVALWRTHIVGFAGHKVPVLFLDTDVGDNAPEDRDITHRLYGGDNEMRLLQEAVLGFGGLQAIQTVYPEAKYYHLNEGHTSFVPLAQVLAGASADAVRRRCHFTTHTPVPAGHDVFPYDMAARVLGPLMPSNIRTLAGDAALSMSELALSLCGTANGVSALHGEVARDMFPGRGIGHITNGVHHHTWVSAPLGTLFDRALPGWRSDPRILARAGGLPEAGLWDAHSQAKETLLRFMNAETGQGYAPAVLTLGFARRAAAYKRAALLFRDIERLTRICQGKVQFVFAGKAHPRDEAGHRLIQTIVQAGHTLGGKVRVGYVSNYTMWTGALITAGVDVWLNTPLRPHEASGTSGMKAALNGVPSASIADGWWAEGARDNENGWVIGSPERCDDEADAESLYRTLEERVIPTYYDNRSRWVGLMQQAIVTGADFTADRMVREYHSKYYSTL